MPVKFDRPMVRRLFDKTDTDGSGGLDREEIQVLADSLGTSSDTAAFDEIDVNGNGIVEFDEFFEWYNKFSDQMAELKAVAEAERAEAEEAIAAWAISHAQRADDHEQEWKARVLVGRTAVRPTPPPADSPVRAAPRRRIRPVDTVDTRVWRLQSFVLSGLSDDVFDGVWVVDDSNPLVHGRPHFINQYGFHVFFAPDPARWILHTDLTPDDPGDGVAIRKCADGEDGFPLGDGSWMVWERLVADWVADGEEGEEGAAGVTAVTLNVSERNRPPSIGGLGCLDVLPAGRAPPDPPTAQEVADYAMHLSISAETDQHLFWLAEEALCAPLPLGWTEHVHDPGGQIFYRGPAADGTVTSSHWHPLEEQYKDLVHLLRDLISSVRTAFRAVDSDGLEEALRAYLAAVQEHRSATQKLLETEKQHHVEARFMRFRVGVFAVRVALSLPELLELKTGPTKRAKSGGEYVAAEQYIPGAFAAHYPLKNNAHSRLRAEGHTAEDISEIEITLKRMLRKEPTLFGRGAWKVMHAHHQRAPARLPPRATALAAKTATARLRGQGMAILTAAEMTRNLAHMQKGEPVSGHAGQHRDHDDVADETALRLEKSRMGTLHMADRAGADTLMPLHIAARKGDADTVAHLLLDGADVNFANFAKQTPLHEAALQGRNEVVDLLLGETGIRSPFFCFCVGKREDLRATRPDMDWKARNKEMSILWHGTPATNATFTGDNVRANGVEDTDFPGWDFREHPEALSVVIGGVTKTTLINEDCRTLERAVESLTRSFLWIDEELEALAEDEEGESLRHSFFRHSVHPVAQRSFYAKALHMSQPDALNYNKLLNGFAREMHPICPSCAMGKKLDQKEFEAEFGFNPEGCYDLPLDALAEKMTEGYTSLGKVTANHVNKMLSNKMPATFSAMDANLYLQQTYNLGSNRTASVLLHAVTMQPLKRFASVGGAQAFLESAAEDYGKQRQAPMKKGGGGVVCGANVSAFESLCCMLALKFARPLADVLVSSTINSLSKCPSNHANTERHDLLLAAQQFFKDEQRYEREVVGGMTELVDPGSDPTQLATIRGVSIKEVEAEYTTQLGALMKERQQRRWVARVSIQARRLRRAEELLNEPGTDVPETAEDFRERLQRNFIEGVDTLRTTRMIVEEISGDRLNVDSGLATRAKAEYGVKTGDVAAALGREEASEQKKAVIALIVEARQVKEESSVEHVSRLLREAGPMTEKADRLRTKLQTIHHIVGLESMEPELHRLELIKYATKAGVKEEFLAAVTEDLELQGDPGKALVALVVDCQITQHETDEEHIARLLNEVSRRTNKDKYDDFRMVLENIEVTSISELAMAGEEELDAEEAVMFADEKAKLDVMIVEERRKSETNELEYESNEEFHKRLGRLYNPKKGDLKLPRLASQYFEDTQKALGKIQHRRMMTRDSTMKALMELHKRKKRLLPWATVTANTNDKLVITCGSTGLRSTIALAVESCAPNSPSAHTRAKTKASSGAMALALFGSDPPLEDGKAVRLPLSQEKRLPFLTKSMRCSRLCSKVEVEPIDQWGHTPLHVAARWQQKEVVQLILNHGGLIDGHGKRYTDALFLRGNDAVELAAQLRKICLIQGQWRYRMYQRWFTAWKTSVMVLQNRWRFRMARKEWFDRRAACIAMQALWRGFKGRKLFALVKQDQAAPKLLFDWAQFCKTTKRDHVCMLYRMGDCPHVAQKCRDNQLPEWEEGGDWTLRDELKKMHLGHLAPKRSTARHVEPPVEEWQQLVEVCKKANVAVPMIEAYGAAHGGNNEPKRAEVLHFLKKPEVQKHLELCGDLISEIHGPGMCFRSAADPDGMRVRKSGASSLASTNLFFSVPKGKELDVDSIRNTVTSLKGFLSDPLKFRVTDCKTALMCFFESESLAADAMSHLQNNPKAMPPMTEVIFGKQAKAPNSKTQSKALFLELDDDGSGYLDDGEVDALMKRMGKWMNKFEIAQCMAAMDEDGNNEVSLEEFDIWFKANGNKFTSAEDTELTKMVESDGRKSLDEVNDQRPTHTVPEEELLELGASGWASKSQRFSTGRNAEALRNRWEEICKAKPKQKGNTLQQMANMRQKQAALMAEQAQEAAIHAKEEEERASERAAEREAVEIAINLQNQHEDAELASIERKKNLDKLRDANRCVVGDTRALSDEAYMMACALIQRTTVAKPLLPSTPGTPGTPGRAASQAASRLISNEFASSSLVEAAAPPSVS